MKKFWGEFKKFISRGNILDLAVGVIVGGAFTAIVTALTNKIIRPFINWILAAITGGSGLDAVVTFLGDPVMGADGKPDLTKSIYIDWGSFITAILDFFIIALTVFLILKAVMKSKELMKESAEKMKKATLSKAERKELKAAGISPRDKVAVAAYFAEKEAEAARLKAEEEAKAKAAEEEAKKNTTEYLLREIRDLLAENKALKEEVKEAASIAEESKAKKPKAKKVAEKVEEKPKAKPARKKKAE
ncbi:MAG: large conductance mechanosensitive channel protein MscL [Clostridia bacterium]|nr:large conductance mechanosensitive channel protein MscL [Clostridia bacterium]